MDQKKKKELIARIIAGVILIPLTVYFTLFAERLWFFILLECLILLATREFIPLVRHNDNFVQVPLIWAGAVSIPIILYFGLMPVLIVTLFLLIFIVFLLKMFSSSPTEKVFEDVSMSFFSIIFIPFLFSFFQLVRDVDAKWLIFLLIVIWLSDTCAYFTGISIGKRKLIPKVSPGKTIEGLIGGIIGALVGAFLLNYYFFHISILLMAMIAIDIIIAGIIGDLIESMLKRGAAVKDSGHLIPGHGGILDRFDSLLFAAPVLYFYLYFIVG